MMGFSFDLRKFSLSQKKLIRNIFVRTDEKKTGNTGEKMPFENHHDAIGHREVFSDEKYDRSER